MTTKNLGRSLGAIRLVFAGVAVIVRNEKGQVLMGQRKGSHGAGSWSFIGGWMEHGESFLDTARREAMEEAGIDVSKVSVVHAMSTVFKMDPKSNKLQPVHSVTILLRADVWSGVPRAMEPHKLEGEWQWFDPNNLPSPLFEPLDNLALTGESLHTLIV